MMTEHTFLSLGFVHTHCGLRPHGVQALVFLEEPSTWNRFRNVSRRTHDYNVSLPCQRQPRSVSVEKNWFFNRCGDKFYKFLLCVSCGGVHQKLLSDH